MNVIAKLTAMKNRKGFTLVELIVVLVILAILAALLVPTLTGYIDKANEKKIVAEARMVLMAAQTVGSETYGTIGKFTKDSPKSDAATPPAATSKEGMLASIAKLAEAPAAGTYTITYDASAKVTKLVYSDGARKATYNGSTFTVTEDKTTVTTAIILPTA